MRDATGELNMTVIVFAAVALLTALFFFIVWPMIKEGLRKDESCSSAICEHGYNDNNMAWCYNQNDPANKFECPYRG